MLHPDRLWWFDIKKFLSFVFRNQLTKGDEPKIILTISLLPCLISCFVLCYRLGLAYAGSNRDDVLSLLLPVLGDSKASMEVVGMAALACGMVSVGSCNGEVTSTILQTLMEKSETDLKTTYARFLALGLALTYLGKQESAEAILAALQVTGSPPLRQQICCNTCCDVWFSS